MELMKHQKDAVGEIFENYNKGNNKVIYTSGVGTGKTSVFCGVAKNIEGKILYIVPKKAIIANVVNNKMFKQEKLESRTEFTTFNYFSDETKGEKLDEYELIVIDEAHHIGSDIYGKNLINCLKARSIKTLGLTATPKRMDDIDIQTLFDAAVNGLTNFEAIKQGLMPRIEYLICSPEDEIDLNSAVVDWKNSYKLLKEAIHENQKNKWICFFSKIAELKAMKQYIKIIFPNYEILEVHSNSGNVQQILNKANKFEKCVMLNCDMLLEGLHFDNVDGIILFRNVHSVPVFEQIIGRVSAMFKNENPLVIDCTDTWLRMDRYIIFEDYKTSNETSKIKYSGSSGFRDNADVTLTPCYISLKNKKYYNYMEFLREKHNRNKSDNFVYFRNECFRSWKNVCDAYNISPATVWSYKIRNSTTIEDAINYTIEYTNKNKEKKWTDAEKKIFFKYYPKEGSAVAKRLNGKNEEQCRSYARRYGIKTKAKKKTNKKWTDAEISILQEYYPLEGANVVERLEGRNKEQCRCKARRLGVKIGVIKE